MDAKICGIKDINTLKYITGHNHSPKFIGFIVNYIKSKRYVEYNLLKKLLYIDKNKTNYVAVLVDPDKNILNKIKYFNFDYYQLYNVSPEQTKFIKNQYKKKIISALTIKNRKDVDQYKKYEFISDIILFDSKGYEKSIGFDHKLLNDVPGTITKMLAGNIQYNDKLDNYSKITDIIDISGSLETSGEKDISKINIFLENIYKIRNAN
tara:strand:+ start:132 stop:755 length:624 start_codon:yes stop_codon:yes gene_type:complete